MVKNLIINCCPDLNIDDKEHISINQLNASEALDEFNINC